jgi:hypothetical protein
VEKRKRKSSFALGSFLALSATARLAKKTPEFPQAFFEKMLALAV